MYTSPNDRKTALRYAAAALGCGAVSAVYEVLSHGVRSDAMIFVFLYPLISGVLFGLKALLRLPCRRAGLPRALWHCGTATLACGSFLTGVMEIYGTDDPYRPVFAGAGSVLLAGAVLLYALPEKNFRSGRNRA